MLGIGQLSGLKGSHVGVVTPAKGPDMGDMSREPSMEDILSSIRRVIAREDAVGDTPVPRTASRAPAAEPGDEPRADDMRDILDLDDEHSDADGDGAAATPVASELVSAKSADAARQSLEALTAVVAPAVIAAREEQGLPGGGLTVEALVREALRPMLKAWLDANLPEMVEAMVAREIARISSKRL